MLKREVTARVDYYATDSVLKMLKTKNPIASKDINTIIYIPTKHKEANEASMLTLKSLKNVVDTARRIKEELLKVLNVSRGVSFLIRIETSEILIFLNEDFLGQLSYFYYPRNLEPPIPYKVIENVVI